jgi:hypothetical protein
MHGDRASQKGAIKALRRLIEQGLQGGVVYDAASALVSFGDKSSREMGLSVLLRIASDTAENERVRFSAAEDLRSSHEESVKDHGLKVLDDLAANARDRSIRRVARAIQEGIL